MKTRKIIGILDDEPSSYTDPAPSLDEPTEHASGIVSYRVQTHQSPYMDVLLGHHVVRFTIDSGATENMVRHSTAQRLRAPITFTSQSVYQADGFSPLSSLEKHASASFETAESSCLRD